VKRRSRVVLATTVPQTAAAFLAEQAQFLAVLGWDVHLVTSPGPEIAGLSRLDGVTLHLLQMRRELSPLDDVRGLLAWIRLLRSVRPIALMVGTPKAALLGLLAARYCAIPHRIYLVRGLRLEGLDGLACAMSWLAERTATACSHQVVCVSQSLAEQLVKMRLCSANRTRVLGMGSSNGVDIARFHPAGVLERAGLRERLGLAHESVVIGFVGRLTEDKGINTLVRAVRVLHDADERVVLLLVGRPDKARPLGARTEALLKATWVVQVGHLDDPAEVYRAMDMFALPSCREGFPNAVLEAAATGLPAVVSDATGCRDSVVDHATGRVAASENVEAFVQALASLIADPKLRSSMGAQARKRAADYFRKDRVWRNVDSFLNEMLAADGQPASHKRTGRQGC
jgi:glycosyltransferase involved in cell wall biosynthesis